MKMTNKKGFTLAELLIVIAIIAILIAIAIPAFSAQLDSAKLQADHSNMRSAYAVVQTVNLIGKEAADTGFEIDAVYLSNGEFGTVGSDNQVLTQAKHADTKASCKTAAFDCSAFTDVGKTLKLEGYESSDPTASKATKDADATYYKIVPGAAS